MIESGKVRAFATTGAAPSPALPQVPALAASDRKLADFVYGTWIAFLVPAKTPDATVAQLNRAIVAAMQDASFREYVTSTGMELEKANSLADMARNMMIARMRAGLQTGGLAVDALRLSTRQVES